MRYAREVPPLLLSPLSLTAASALLLLLSAPHVGLGIGLIWFALIPWLVALERVGTRRQALVLGAALSLLFNVTIYAWGAYAIHEFTHIPWVASGALLVAGSVIAQPQFWVFAWIYRELAPRREALAPGPWGRLASGVFLALAYTGLDWATPKLFPDTLGHAFTGSPWFRQVAELGGVHLLTFLVVLANDTILGLWRARKRLAPMAPEAVACAALIAAFAGFGSWRHHDVQERMASAETRVRVAAIQGNIPSQKKFAAFLGVKDAADQSLARYLELSEAAAASKPPPHLIVWPETAYPHFFNDPLDLRQAEREGKVREFARRVPIPLAFGAYERAQSFAESPAVPRQYNSLLFVQGDADRRIAYRKHLLLHFGEYLPGELAFPRIRDWVPPQVGHFVAGEGPKVVPLRLPLEGGGREVSILPLICYEAIFPWFVRLGAALGADLMLNVTNDSWFGPWGEPQLHLALSAFRSIETRIPQIRVTNTGITALVLPDGEIVGATSLDEALWKTYEIPILKRGEPTLFVRWGDWFGPFCLTLTVLAVLLVVLRSRHERNHRR